MYSAALLPVHVDAEHPASARAGEIAVVAKGEVSALGVAAVEQVADSKSDGPDFAKTLFKSRMNKAVAGVAMRVGGIKPVAADVFDGQFNVGSGRRLPVQLGAGQTPRGGRNLLA